MARSGWRGGIIADAMGLGKSFTVLLAALTLQKEMKPNCGFILIICRKACVFQWKDELEKHFVKVSHSVPPPAAEGVILT
jgi:SNF2 family DNA or RNA helicase